MYQSLIEMMLRLVFLILIAKTNARLANGGVVKYFKMLLLDDMYRFDTILDHIFNAEPYKV